MIVDSSAILAIFFHESGAEALLWRSLVRERAPRHPERERGAWRLGGAMRVPLCAARPSRPFVLARGDGREASAAAARPHIHDLLRAMGR